MNKLRENVYSLSQLHGISSREDDVIEFMVHAFLEINKDVCTDVIGNVICRFSCGKKEAKRLLVFAHTDEIGFIVRNVEQNGFLRITRVGGVHVNVLPGSKVDVIGDNKIYTGVIGIKSHHVTKPEEKYTIPNVDDVYIDVGAESYDEVESLGIHIGSFATFASQPVLELGQNKLCGKAMDDRCCCAALIEYAKNLRKLQEEDNLFWDVYVVACVQEEFNVRGIMPAVNAINPNASIGLDICIATDTPELKGYSDITLGKGLAITYMNFHGRGTLAGVLPDKLLLKALEDTCKDNNINFQREVIIGLITENAFIAFQNEGVPVANISVPCRYSHTATETIDERDIQAIVKLLTAFTAKLNGTESFGKNVKKY